MFPGISAVTCHYGVPSLYRERQLYLTSKFLLPAHLHVRPVTGLTLVASQRLLRPGCRACLALLPHQRCLCTAYVGPRSVASEFSSSFTPVRHIIAESPLQCCHQASTKGFTISRARVSRPRNEPTASTPFSTRHTRVAQITAWSILFGELLLKQVRLPRLPKTPGNRTP